MQQHSILLSACNDLPIDTLKEQLTIEGRKRLMSIAEQLREEGEKKGEKKGKLKVAKKLLLLNMDETQIMEATDLTMEEIEQIKKEIK